MGTFWIKRMSCCGKIKKLGSIGLSHINFINSEVFKVPRLKYEHTDERVGICLTCDFNTYMPRNSYIAWFLSNAKAIMKNMEDLTVLPMLPKQEERPGGKMFCRVCKCWIAGKARMKNETCPKGYWIK